MAIAPTDILIKLTTAAGSAGNTTAQANPNASLGKYTSTTTMVAGANTLFDNVTGAENAASTVDYRAVDILNNHATLTLNNAVVYLSNISGGTDVTIATDNVGPVAKTSAAQGSVIANETTAPTGVGAFSAPVSAAAGLPLGDIGPGQIRRVWIKRAASNSAAKTGDGFTLFIAGDTDA